MVNYASCTLKTFFNTSLQLKGDSGNYFKIPTGILLSYILDWITYLHMIGLHIYVSLDYMSILYIIILWHPLPPPSLDEGMAKQLDQPSLPIKKKEDINNYARPSDYSLK